MDQFAHTFFSVIACPRLAFKHLCQAAPGNCLILGQAALAVVLVFFFDGLRLTAPFVLVSLPLVLAAVLASILSGLVLWLSIIAVALAAGAFAGSSRGQVEALAVASAWAFLPWLFMTPLGLWEAVFGFGVNCLIGLVLFLWSLSLFYLAVREAFVFSNKQMLFLCAIIPSLVLLSATLFLAQIVSEAVSLFL